MIIEPHDLKHKGHYNTNDGRQAIVLGNLIVLYEVTIIEVEGEDDEEILHSPMHTLRDITQLEFSQDL